MAQFLISFPSDAMDQIPEDEMPDVTKAAHAVCQEAIDAGVYVLAGGLEDQPASIVATDGTVIDGPKPPNSTRCSARPPADGDVPRVPERRALSSAGARAQQHERP
jgi:hypothetical protein